MIKMYIDTEVSGFGSYNYRLDIEVIDESKKNILYSNSFAVSSGLSIFNIIDEFNVDEVVTNKDYLVELAVNSYKGREFTYDYTYDEAKKEYTQYRYSGNNATLVGNTFDIYYDIDDSVFINTNSNNPFKYKLNDNRYIKYARTLVKNIENNLEFLKLFDVRPNRYDPMEYHYLTVIFAKALFYAGQDESMTNEEIDEHLKTLESLIKVSGDYSLSNKLNLIEKNVYYSQREYVKYNEFKVNKYLLSKMINIDINYAASLKSKCQVTKLDNICNYLIQNVVPLDSVYTHRVSFYNKDFEYVENLKEVIDTSLIDFSLIENFDKFLELLVKKNLKRTKAYIPFQFGYLVCPDKFPWDKFDNQRLLNVIPSIPNEENTNNDDVPDLHKKYIRRFAFNTERELISAFTYLNMLSEEDLNKYLDHITYNLFQAMLVCSVDKFVKTLKLAIYMENNIDKDSWRWSADANLESMINSNNIKILFNNLIKYYDEHANSSQIKKLIKIIDDLLPAGFIDQNVSKKFRKLRMEMKIN